MSESNKKYYTMQEMAEQTGVNKSTVYRYLSKESIAPATTKRNTNLYDAKTMQRLKKHFNKKNSNNSEKKSANDLLIETLRQQVASLQGELSDEKSRSDKALTAKDKQIDDLNARLAESHQLQLGLQKELETHKNNPNRPVLDGQTVANNSSETEEETQEQTTENKKTTSNKWWKFW